MLNRASCRSYVVLWIVVTRESASSRAEVSFRTRPTIPAGLQTHEWFLEGGDGARERRTWLFQARRG